MDLSVECRVHFVHINGSKKLNIVQSKDKKYKMEDKLNSDQWDIYKFVSKFELKNKFRNVL